MAYPEKKYPDNMRTATGFKASDKLNAAFTHARQDAHAKSGEPYDGAMRLDDHPQVMQLFMTELLEQLGKGGEPKSAARIGGK